MNQSNDERHRAAPEVSIGDLRLLRGSEVEQLLLGREREVLEQVRNAYLAHADGLSELPHSTFLGFPQNASNRIIALPAYLGGQTDRAGLKWISSFPGNREKGLRRASALMVLNSTVTGRPTWVLEGSIISSVRTAASAALAARAYFGEATPASVGVIGTGVINREIVRFLQAHLGDLPRLLLYDVEPDRAVAFGEQVTATLAVAADRVVIAEDLDAVLTESALVSIATTAVEPHIASLAGSPPGGLILHVSLRDLTPAVILTNDNVVDDVDHVCRAATSVHLAEQSTGSRDFIRCTIADLLRGDAPPKANPDSTTIFSPFGLGVLDLAVAHLISELAQRQSVGQVVRSFFPG